MSDFTQEQYKAAIPRCCSATMQEHLDMLLCWGLAASLRDGTPMNCSGCDRKNPAIPSPSDNPGRRMTRAEAEAMERAFWRSVDIIEEPLEKAGDKHG
jgi:hypothetical protein